jgi:hypothetical protein
VVVINRPPLGFKTRFHQRRSANPAAPISFDGPQSDTVVHVADHLVNALQLGSSGERFVPPLSWQAWKHSGLTCDVLDSVVKTIDEQLATVEEVFLPAQRGQR